MKIVFCILVLSGFAIAGCKKGGNSASPSAPASPKGLPTMPAAPAASAPVAPPPGEPGYRPAPAPAAPALAPVEETKDPVVFVTGAVQNFWIAKERPPKDLNELVSSGYLKALPTPPAGKKFVYDPNKMAISLVNQ